TAVCLPDIEGRGVVLMNNDPRIELPEVGIGIRTRTMGRCCRSLGVRCRDERVGARRAEAHDKQACALEKAPARRRHVPLFQFFFDLFWNVREGRHATTSFPEPALASAITFAPRLMAA